MAKAVPHSRKHLDKYDTVKIEAESFHNYLVKIGMHLIYFVLIVLTKILLIY